MQQTLNLCDVGSTPSTGTNVQFNAKPFDLKVNKNMKKNICENCGNEHDGSYGSGRFCSAHCRRVWIGKQAVAKRM